MCISGRRSKFLIQNAQLCIKKYYGDYVYKSMPTDRIKPSHKKASCVT